MKIFVIISGFLSLSSATKLSPINLNKTCDGIHCVTERQFLSCDPDVPHLFTCSLRNQYCSEKVLGGCTSDESLKTEATLCGVCGDENGTSHTCLGPSTFSPCINGKKVLNETKECPSGLYCNALARNSAEPCSKFTGKELLCWKHEAEEEEEEEKEDLQACSNCASNPNGITCLNERQYTYCNDERKIIYTCPLAEFCSLTSTGNERPCSAIEPPTGCSSCNLCATDGKFSCTSPNTYEECGGTGAKTSLPCPAGEYCNAHYKGTATHPCASFSGREVLCWGISSVTPFCEEKPDGFYEHTDPTKFCGWYMECAGGRVFQRQCPRGTYFSVESKRCENEPVSGLDCEERNHCKINSLPQGKYEYPNDCSSFITCLNGETKHYWCGPGRNFWPAVKNCVPETTFSCA